MSPAKAAESVQDATKHCPSCSCFKPRPKRRTGIKRDAGDIRFSAFVRGRAHLRCQRCGRQYESGSQGLHCAHMYSRRIKATRTDPDNAAALCFGCHQYIDSHPNEKLAFFRDLLGDEAFDALSARAHAKRDRLPKRST